MNWEEKYNAIAELVDGYRRERDEARREADRFRHGCTVEGDFVCPNEYAVSELTAERNFLRALKKNHEEDFTRVCKERDEARAEADRWKRSCNVFRERDWPKAFQATVTSLEQEVFDAHEQLAKLRKLSKPWEGDAYRRGAEAMRKRCAMWIKHNSHEDGLGMGSQRIESALAALPIPEEP